MNRETEYRGKRVDGGGWVYGYYVKGSTRHCILHDLGGIQIDVIPSTAGEWTGRKDIFGDKLYEDDKFLAQDEDEPKEETWVIKFIDGCFIADRKNGNYPLKMDYWAESEIHKIGTIHDTEEQAK